MLLSVLVAALGVTGVFETIQEWDFSDEAVITQWRANAHLTDVAAADGALHSRAIDWDPFFTCSGLEINATATQCVHIRIRADRPGNGQLFWSGVVSGAHGGFSAEKVADFSVADKDGFQDIHLFPLWHGEETIRQLRLDVYDGARFAIERVAVLERDGETARQDQYAWNFSGGLDGTGWLSLNEGLLLAGPPLALPLSEAGWISIAARAVSDATITVEWATADMLGGHRETIYLRGDNALRHYHIEKQGHPDWEGTLVGLNLYLPHSENITVEGVTLAAEPAGPPDLEVAYFGFENGVSRAGRPESVLAQFTNRGGGHATIGDVRLEMPSGATVVEGPTCSGEPTLEHGAIQEVRWQVEAEQAGTFQATLFWGRPEVSEGAAITFLPSVNHTAAYVPEPTPIESSVEICAYYFPGWDGDAKYDCLRNVAPIRKPLLGYYDERNPECVDWQIKWAVENGIHCFLVDWYWVDGSQSLLHWFEAYRKARYRDYLKVAIMWANHNPPGTHSREDWRNVTREWIENYFTLDTYYHINGKPAVFLWDSAQLRDDLGGSDAVAEALIESQVMAQAAGHEGIAFVVLQHNATAQDMALWAQEGYEGNTSYHEFGRALHKAPSPSQAQFADVVTTAPETWQERRKQSGDLAYYPVVDTGWDSRPWHGPNAMAFHGRTVAGFRDLLESAREFLTEHDKGILVLGPLNEWGEGSYIEPNLEFGFAMYEAIREVFGAGDPAAWPVNLSPRDVGLGPYDFPTPPRTLSWNFETGAEGWAAMMGVTDFEIADGVMRFRTTSRDPALVVSTRGLNASVYTKMRIRMKIIGQMTAKSAGQVFWTIGSGSTSEATSYRFPLERSDDFHEYTLSLDEHPRWRGRINMIRFDPCETSDVLVSIDRVAFEKE